jgi:hypothetical protein
MYKIENPAEKIHNPAATIYNPATEVDNPAANIYNPASRMNNPDSLSPPTQAVPKPAVTEAAPATKTVEQIKDQPRSKPEIPHKYYHFKTVRAYISAANKAFIQDDYREFISVTEDALRRINAGTLKASGKTKLKLAKFREFGYGLLKGKEE